MRAIKTLLVAEFGEAVASAIDVNSVDGFQGREKEVMLLSCVRSDYGREYPLGIGFVRDERRVNVMLTRARHSVFVLGHGDTFKQDEMWAALFENAKERDCLIEAPTPVAVWFESACKKPALAPAAGGGDKDAPAIKLEEPIRLEAPGSSHNEPGSAQAGKQGSPTAKRRRAAR